MILERGKGLLQRATNYFLGPKTPQQTVIGRIPANIEIFENQVGSRKHFMTESGQPMECLVGYHLINVAVALQRPGAQPPRFIQLLQALANTTARHALGDGEKNVVIQERSTDPDNPRITSAFRGDKTFVSATTVQEEHPNYDGSTVTTSVWYTDPTDVRVDGTDMHCFGGNTVSVSVDHIHGSQMNYQFEMRVDPDTFQIQYRSDGFQSQGGVELESMPEPRVFSIRSGDEIFSGT